MPKARFCKDNPMYGKSLSEEHKLKISNSLKKSMKRDEESPHWKGDNISYRGLHAWVVRKLGKPNMCSNCKKDNLYGRQIHWANISHEYKRDLYDWIRLCQSCHRNYDLGKIELCV